MPTPVAPNTASAPEDQTAPPQLVEVVFQRKSPEPLFHANAEFLLTTNGWGMEVRSLPDASRAIAVTPLPPHGRTA